MPLAALDFIAIAQGRVPGMSAVLQNGRNPTVGSTLEPIWNHSTAHTWPTTAAAHFISSSNGADTQAYTVTGLDANSDEQIISVTAAGQTKSMTRTINSPKPATTSTDDPPFNPTCICGSR